VSGSLAGKVALITGAARGVGAATAARFVAEGAQVVLTDVLGDDVAGVAADLGPAAAAYPHDVADEDAWTAIVSATVEQFGGLDVLINNAAILTMSAIEDTSAAEFERIVRINQIGPFLGIKAVIPAMRASGGGSIVSIGSIDGLSGMNGIAGYASSKAALHGLTTVAALELGPYGIRVNTVHPGGTDTPMWGEAPDEVKAAAFALQAIPRIGRPEEIAAAALFLASDESSYCTGSALVVDGGHTAGRRVAVAPGF
jgi:3alpha(or 20beta)-hydroxysteroid dehydrogenase